MSATATKQRRLGVFSPMRFEASIDECLVTNGTIPKEIEGGFYRCGPSWRRPTVQGSYGIMSVDGMVQALTLRDGKARYLNRWIRTPKFVAEEKHGRALFRWEDGEFGDWRVWGGGFSPVIKDPLTQGIPSGTNAINVFPFNGEVMAVGEQGSPPIALDPWTLETKGFASWSPQLSAGMADKVAFGDASFTAHPKWDQQTGKVYGWTYRDKSPYVTVHVVNPDGTVVTRDLTDAPYNTVAHDIWLTPTYMVIPFQPYIADFARNKRGLGVFGWEPERPIILALVPRDNIETGEIRWITADIETQFILHTMSGNETNGKITLDAPIFNRAPFHFEDQFKPGDPFKSFWELGQSSLGRWTIDLESGSVKSERLDDRPCELPKVDERFYGRGYRWGYLIAGEHREKGGMRLNRLVVRDVVKDTEDVYKFEFHLPVEVMEPTFVPRSPDAAEGDGWLIVPLSHYCEGFGEYVFFDAADITQGPIARVEIPFHMGWTPHGHWMDFRAPTS